MNLNEYKELPSERPPITKPGDKWKTEAMKSIQKDPEIGDEISYFKYMEMTIDRKTKIIIKQYSEKLTENKEEIL